MKTTTLGAEVTKVVGRFRIGAERRIYRFMYIQAKLDHKEAYQLDDEPVVLSGFADEFLLDHSRSSIDAMNRRCSVGLCWVNERWSDTGIWDDD